MKQFEITQVYFGLFIRLQRNKNHFFDLPETQTNKGLNVIIMSSSATDQTREGTVEHAADTIKKKTAESKGMNKIMFLALTEESTSASLTVTVLKTCKEK